MSLKGRPRFQEDYVVREESSRRMRDANNSRSILTTNMSPSSHAIRLLQFFVTITLFSLIVFMIVWDKKPLKEFSLILLMVVTAFFLFFILCDLYQQFAGKESLDSSIFLVSCLGMILFGLAGILLTVYCSTQPFDFWAIPCCLGLCFINAILCLVEILQFVAFWQKRLASCHPLSPTGPPTETLFTKACKFPSSDTQVCKCEMTTSISGGVCIDTGLDSVIEEHGARKTSVGRRRQYKDQHSSVPELAILTATQVQTESGATSPAEAQTTRTEYKETLIQTTNQAAPMTPDGTRSMTPCHSPPSAQATSYQSHCAPVCPASVLILRSGNSCCGTCNCGGQHGDKSPQLHYLNQAQDPSCHGTLNLSKSQWIETPTDTSLSERRGKDESSNPVFSSFEASSPMRTSHVRPRKTQRSQTQILRHQSTSMSDESIGGGKIERKRSKSSLEKIPSDSKKSLVSKTPEIQSKIKSERPSTDMYSEENERKSLEIETKLSESLSRSNSSKRVKPLYREKPPRSQRPSDDSAQSGSSIQPRRSTLVSSDDPVSQGTRLSDVNSWLSDFDEPKRDSSKPENPSDSRKTSSSRRSQLTEEEKPSDSGKSSSSRRSQMIQRSSESLSQHSPLKIRSSASYTLRQETPRFSSVDEGNYEYLSKTPSRLSLSHRDDDFSMPGASVMEPLDEAEEQQSTTGRDDEGDSAMEKNILNNSQGLSNYCRHRQSAVTEEEEENEQIFYSDIIDLRELPCGWGCTNPCSHRKISIPDSKITSPICRLS